MDEVVHILIVLDAIIIEDRGIDDGGILLGGDIITVLGITRLYMLGVEPCSQ